MEQLVQNLLLFCARCGERRLRHQLRQQGGCQGFYIECRVACFGNAHRGAEFLLLGADPGDLGKAICFDEFMDEHRCQCRLADAADAVERHQPGAILVQQQIEQTLLDSRHPKELLVR